MSQINYGKIGLKCGIEFHQMLETKEKLFCHCPTKIKKDKPDYTFVRRLRPTMSEMGEIDRAALFEFEKCVEYLYQGYHGNTCLVEMDEEPPHDLNREALETALLIALMLNSTPLDEIQVMRKIVIDGSNTTGFQRTALVAIGGSVKIEGKIIPIQTICLEEDAARKMEEQKSRVVFRLDRLGIPLIEIATAPVIKSPEEAEKVAYRIGQLLRITGRVKRGLGTIRQDLNISIRDGAKIEVKGVQRLDLISKVIQYEALRQLRLLEIRDELLKRKITKNDLKPNFTDVTEVFKETRSRIISRGLAKGYDVLAIKLPGFRGLIGKEIQPGRRLGTEFADRARFFGGVGGIFHSDELPAYGINIHEIEKVAEILKLGKDDAFVIVVAPHENAVKALNAVLERAKEALEGVPEETRAANPDGTTKFARPRPGAARMYPETDIRPIFIEQKYLERLKSILPEPPEVKLKKFISMGLSEELARKMVASYHLDLFEKIVKSIDVPPVLVASTFENTIKSLKRDGIPIENLSDEHMTEVFRLLEENRIAKEAIPEILSWLAQHPEKNADEAIEALGLRTISEKELKELTRRIILEKENYVKKLKERAYGMLMGEVMKLVRGRIDGKKVSYIVREELMNYLSKL